MAGFAKILFPTDFSKGADHALENVMCLPGVREVVVQHVVSTHFEKHTHWTTLFDIHEIAEIHGHVRPDGNDEDPSAENTDGRELSHSRVGGKAGAADY